MYVAPNFFKLLGSTRSEMHVDVRRALVALARTSITRCALQNRDPDGACTMDVADLFTAAEDEARESITDPKASSYVDDNNIVAYC